MSFHIGEVHMELEDWEYLGDHNNAFEESSSPLHEDGQRQVICEEGQHQVTAAEIVESPALEENQGDVLQVEGTEEIAKENDAAPQVHLEPPEEIEEAVEVDSEEKELVIVKQNSESEFKERVEEEKSEFEFDEDEMMEVMEVDGMETNGRVEGWRRGMGALGSLGLAAACTLSMLILGGSKPNLNKGLQTQQVHADDDKTTTEQLEQQASKMRRALSAMRGTAETAANVSFGGYYQGFGGYQASNGAA